MNGSDTFVERKGRIEWMGHGTAEGGLSRPGSWIFVPLTDCGRSTLAQPAIGIYIDWCGVKSWTGPSARFARNSALTSPRTSP